YSALSEIRGRQGHFPKQTVIGKWPLANALFLNSWLRGRSSGWFSRRGTFDRSRWTYCTVRRNVAKNIVGKTAQVFCDALVTTLQPVISKNGRNSHSKTKCGHDKSFTNRTGNSVNRCLTSDTDFDQCAVNTDNRTEQTNKRRGRTNRCKPWQTGSQLG